MLHRNPRYPDGKLEFVGSITRESEEYGNMSKLNQTKIAESAGYVTL